VQILQERVPQQVLVVGNAHDRGDLLNARDLVRSPPAFPDDQLVVIVSELAYNDGLQQSDLADRFGKFAQFIVVKDASWLFRVRADAGNRDLREVGAVRHRC